MAPTPGTALPLAVLGRVVYRDGTFLVILGPNVLEVLP
jgi:hypothetical protein